MVDMFHAHFNCNQCANINCAIFISSGWVIGWGWQNKRTKAYCFVQLKLFVASDSMKLTGKKELERKITRRFHTNWIEILMGQVMRTFVVRFFERKKNSKKEPPHPSQSREKHIIILCMQRLQIDFVCLFKRKWKMMRNKCASRSLFLLLFLMLLFVCLSVSLSMAKFVWQSRIHACVTLHISLASFQFIENYICECVCGCHRLLYTKHIMQNHVYILSEPQNRNRNWFSLISTLRRWCNAIKRIELTLFGGALACSIIFAALAWKWVVSVW